MNVSLTTEQKVRVTLQPTTESGRPAKIDGVPTWNAEGNSTLNVAEDGLSAEIISADEAGTTVVTVTADADLDEGEVREITETITVDVVDAEAAGLGLSIGAPEPK